MFWNLIHHLDDKNILWEILGGLKKSRYLIYCGWHVSGVTITSYAHSQMIG